MAHPTKSVPHSPRPALLLTLLATTLALPACGVFSSAGALSDPRPYPETMPAGETLDIQVFRDNTVLTMTNATPRDLGPGAVWVNKRFSLGFDEFRSGETITLPLDEFRDRYGTKFRAGGFFATLTPDPVLLAQIEQDGEMLGLIVVRNNAK